MAAAPSKKSTPKAKSQMRSTCYTVTATGVSLSKQACPKCGPGIFMADHSDRATCGRCGYTIFKK